MCVCVCVCVWAGRPSYSREPALHYRVVMGSPRDSPEVCVRVCVRACVCVCVLFVPPPPPAPVPAALQWSNDSHSRCSGGPAAGGSLSPSVRTRQGNANRGFTGWNHFWRRRRTSCRGSVRPVTSHTLTHCTQFMSRSTRHFLKCDWGIVLIVDCNPLKSVSVGWVLYICFLFLQLWKKTTGCQVCAHVYEASI